MTSSVDVPSKAAVREMFILALLYLPLGFFLWFIAASPLMFPVGRLVDVLLTGFFGDVFEQIVQLGFHLEIQTLVRVQHPTQEGIGALDLMVNPMIYAWGMALLFGLVMATPLSVKARVIQLLISFLVITLVTTWGVFWHVLADLAFRAGPEAAAAARGLGMPMEMIALSYQLGYLMLPAVVPVATWILLNRAFIEQHVLRHE